jgi:hypothetical protein
MQTISIPLDAPLPQAAVDTNYKPAEPALPAAEGGGLRKENETLQAQMKRGRTDLH